jgi:hypothetical protein
MIQRIQSIWLLLASICTVLTVKLSFYTGNKLDALTKTKAFVQLNAQSDMVLTVLVGFILAACLIAIFLFKDRKRQLLVTGVTALVAIINIIIYISETRSFVEGQYSITSTITFLIPLFLLLAARGIWKDEQLVKSADRLR